LGYFCLTVNSAVGCVFVFESVKKASLTPGFAAPADHLTISFAERLAAKRIDDGIAGTVQVAEPPALAMQTFNRQQPIDIAIVVI